ncbi:TIGR01777 family oxidoreductase [Bacillus weihaiensis]|uniref:TIGR01777 family protein n=1 Tax=Bacillus weihaiensis TaxID=1547283 RepID=A0A1L3MV99_9BACI|nr:TIGR01777 family oxidoreductase [Bacillus weihaiensis]APH06254.1 TIGR01777 family protein [Bacillus weihaiensis]
MKIAISGGTGFVGKHLTDYFLKQNHDVYILTRSEKTSSKKNLHYIKWLTDQAKPATHLEGVDVVINLAGKSINDRWTDEAKRQIIQSRIEATKAMYSIVSSLERKPSVFINASAIGIYGTSKDQVFTERSTEHGSDFLAETVDVWEKEAKNIQKLGVRTAFTRFGIVLGEEGALPKMLLPYKLFAGGKLGSGTQWMSWIHIDDLVRMIDHVIKTPSLSGPVNVTAPNPVQMNEFGKTIAKTINRPHWLPAPSFAIKAILGEMSILLLEGQKVLPEKAVETSFTFTFPHLQPALEDIVKS